MGILDITFEEDLISLQTYFEVCRLRVTANTIYNTIKAANASTPPSGAIYWDKTYDLNKFEMQEYLPSIMQCGIEFYLNVPHIKKQDLIDWYIREFVDDDMVEEFMKLQPTVYISRWKDSQGQLMAGHSLEVNESVAGSIPGSPKILMQLTAQLKK